MIKDAQDLESENNSDNDLGSNEGDDVQDVTNAGWSDSIAKILKTKKPKGKKSLVLSKAKKLTDVKVKKNLVGFEVATSEGEIKQEFVQEDVAPEPEVKKKKLELASYRVKPNVLERDKERMLTKIATRGVVQLFNTVKMQQKDISKKIEEAGPLDVKKEKAMKSIDKRAFLDVLMGGKNSINIEKQNSKVTDDSTWSVLKDDFMMGAKMKDWDKEVEEEVEDNEEVELESE